MPVYKNISSGEIFFSEIDTVGRFTVKQGATFNGSNARYNQYTSIIDGDILLERQVDGENFAGTVTTGPNEIVLNADGFMQINGVVASTADGVNNAQVTATNSYTVFGKIHWTESGTAYALDFSIIGDGTHTAGATNSHFEFDAASTPPGAAANLPTTAASVIDSKNGTINMRLSGAGTAYADLIVELVYEPIMSGIKIEYDIVTATDVTNDPNYNTGSAGFPKVKRVYNAHNHALLRTTIYLYRDATAAAKGMPTDVIQDFSSVNRDDSPLLISS